MNSETGTGNHETQAEQPLSWKATGEGIVNVFRDQDGNLVERPQ